MVQVATLPESTTTQQTLSEQTATNQTANHQTATKHRFPRQGEWTYQDWLELPDDGWKYEVIDGVLYMSPPPLILHQDISGELSARMRIYARDNKLGKVLSAPCGVRLPVQPVPVEPDILFVKRERLHILDECYVEGAPDLVVAILSPSNATYDLETKFNLYQASGVTEYWVVNGWEQTVTIHQLSDAGYQSPTTYGLGDTVVSQVLSGFQIAVEVIFNL
ncbi:MAG: Uma2 family endonuclease [Caldilineaceae bacterium]